MTQHEYATYIRNKLAVASGHAMLCELFANEPERVVKASRVILLAVDDITEALIAMCKLTPTSEVKKAMAEVERQKGTLS